MLMLFGCIWLNSMSWKFYLNRRRLGGDSDGFGREDDDESCKYFEQLHFNRFLFFIIEKVSREISLEESPKTFASIFCWEKVFLMFSASLNKWKEEFLSFSLSCRMFNFSKKPFSSIELLDPTSNVHFCCSCCFKSIVLDRNIWPWTF